MVVGVGFLWVVSISLDFCFCGLYNIRSVEFGCWFVVVDFRLGYTGVWVCRVGWLWVLSLDGLVVHVVVCWLGGCGGFLYLVCGVVLCGCLLGGLVVGLSGYVGFSLACWIRGVFVVF